MLTEFQLRRHRNQAGYTIGDARTVDLFRYAAWLTLEYFKPKAEPLTYEEQKARQAERNAEAVRAAQDIGEIPAVADPDRKARAEGSFRFFCETYFPEVFYLPWSDDHLRVIEKIEKAVRHPRGVLLRLVAGPPAVIDKIEKAFARGLFAMAMPRGSGKAALDTPLATPTGWTTMGDVQVDDMLFDERGRMCRVTHATQVMVGHPCYRVRFSDGEEIDLRCRSPLDGPRPLQQEESADADHAANGPSRQHPQPSRPQ